MTPSQLNKILKIGIPQHRSFLIVGPPGIGKTHIVQQCAYDVGFECQIFHLQISDPTDIKGMPWIYIPEESSTPTAEFIPFGDLRRLIETKVPTVAFLDDFGQAPPSVQAAAMQLLWGGKLNGHKIPDCVTWLSATNRREDRAAVTGILEPIKSRNYSILNLEADVEDWIAWAIKADVPTVIRTFLRFDPKLLCDFEPTADMRNSPLPRTWFYLGELVKDNYPPEVEQELYAGAVGEGPALEFLAYKKIFTKLPNPKTIVNDPFKEKVPDDPAVLYALTGALANLANDKNMENIVKYAGRLYDDKEFDDNMMRGEFATVLIRDCENINPEVMETTSYIQWKCEHPEV